MSAEAVGWVWKFSQHRGLTLLVHLAVADVVNDAHGNEFWMASGNLAEKVRSTPSSVRRALAALVDAGDLEVVEVGGGVAATRYRFRYIAPHVPYRGGTGAVPARDGGCTEVVRGPYQDATRNTKRTQVNSKPHPMPLVEVLDDHLRAGVPDFEDFYSRYPRKVGRGQAVKAWNKLKRDDRIAAVAAVESFGHIATRAREMAKSPDHAADVIAGTPHPATWLNGERWADDSEATMAYFARKAGVSLTLANSHGMTERELVNEFLGGEHGN